MLPSCPFLLWLQSHHVLASTGTHFRIWGKKCSPRFGVHAWSSGRWRQVYETWGCGKSHILVALACLLVRQGKQVVYLPNCFMMLLDPLQHLWLALLFTIQDASSQEQILSCKTVNNLTSFCALYTTGQLCIIANQLNALDPDPHRRYISTDKAKAELLAILQCISDTHICITSVSANHKSTCYLKKKETGKQKIVLLGGMTTVREMFCIALLSLWLFLVRIVFVVVNPGLRHFQWNQ